MGTKAGPRETRGSLRVRLLVNKGGDVAQLLHPCWIARSDLGQATDLLLQTEAILAARAPHVGLVLTGGGFIEVCLEERHPARYWRTEAALDGLISRCKEVATPILSRLQHAARDYVIGVDLVSEGNGVGQFALLARAGAIQALVWKSYPVGDEGKTLSGYGTEKGRTAPRVADTAVGPAIILVCHDAQAFNHRNRALVRRAKTATTRSKVVSQMDRQLAAGRPAWALDLVHSISKRASMATFHKSLKQISSDHTWRPSGIGSFGYDQAVSASLESLAAECQYPPGVSNCVLAVET